MIDTNPFLDDTEPLLPIAQEQDVVVVISTQRIVLDPVTEAVTIVDAGPVGPPGFAANGTDYYDHEQTVASTSWVANHNLGFYPNVDVYDETGRRLRAAIIHHTVNQAEVQTLTPRMGHAHFS